MIPDDKEVKEASGINSATLGNRRGKVVSITASPVPPLLDKGRGYWLCKKGALIIFLPPRDGD